MTDLIKDRLNRLITQYRESPNLIEMARTYLLQLEAAELAAERYTTKFDLDTAVGDQLTMIGLRLGWPRCHCVCDQTPVFGFNCGGATGFVGFCDKNSTWAGCDTGGVSEFCINDDAIYRTFLKVRIAQINGQFEIETLTDAVKWIWPEGRVAGVFNQKVVIAPMVEGIDQNDPLLQLWPRVLPVTVGVRILYHFGTRPTFGFGSGSSGFADCAEDLLIADESGILITDESDNAIAADSMLIPNVSDWLCQIDPSPC